jgi:hypothetical protein
MSLAKRLPPVTLQQEGDKHALLMLQNLRDSWKWIFTILMAGSAVIAGQSLISWADSVYSKYAGIPIPRHANIIYSSEVPTNLELALTFLLFLIYALTLFRFYWGWIRYCDLKYIEVPSLIVSFRRKFFRQAIPEIYEAALNTAFHYSQLHRVLFDTIPVFFQTTVIFVIAGSLNSADNFIRNYIVLLVINSIYLFFSHLCPPYHRDALLLAFDDEIACLVTPQNQIKIWIVNNTSCAVIMLISLHYTPGPPLTPLAALIFVFVMFANCLIDLIGTWKMYSRPVEDLRNALSKF